MTFRVPQITWIVWFLDRPSENLKTSNTSSEVELISQSFTLSTSLNPTNDDLLDELSFFISMVDNVALLEWDIFFSSFWIPINYYSDVIITERILILH